MLLDVLSQRHGSVFADDEADGVGTNGDADWCDGPLAEQPPIEADGGTTKIEQFDAADAGWMNVGVVEELAFAQQPETAKHLRNGGTGDDRHVKESVVGYGIGCLPKPCGIADADGHDVLSDGFAVGAHGNLERLALKDISDEDGEQREPFGSHQAVPAVGKFNEFGTKSDIDAVEEIAREVLAFVGDVFALSYIYEASATRDDVVDGTLIVVG